MFQGDLRYKLSVGASDLGSLTVIPEKDVQDHIIVAWVEVMAMRYPPGGIAVYFDIPSLACTIDEGNTGLLKIRASLQVPTPRRMDSNLSTVQCAQRYGAPTLIEPQAPHQLFRDAAVPGYWCFGDPGTRWRCRIEVVPRHCRVEHRGPCPGWRDAQAVRRSSLLWLKAQSLSSL